MPRFFSATSITLEAQFDFPSQAFSASVTRPAATCSKTLLICFSVPMPSLAKVNTRSKKTKIASKPSPMIGQTMMPPLFRCSKTVCSRSSTSIPASRSIRKTGVTSKNLPSSKIGARVSGGMACTTLNESVPAKASRPLSGPDTKAAIGPNIRILPLASRPLFMK